MSVRLTKKKQKEILGRIDQIVMLHRGKIYVTLSQPHHAPRIDQASVDTVQCLLGEMNDQLVREIMPMLEEVISPLEPVLPIKV